MHTKIGFKILVVAAFILLIMVVDALPRIAEASPTVPIKLKTQNLVDNSASSIAEPLILTGEQGKYPLGLHLGILEDPTARLTIEDVSSPALDKQFIQSTEQVPNYGYTNSAYWLRLHLLNKTNSINQWFLESYFQNLNYVDLYIPSEGGGFIQKESGALRPFATRDIPYYHVVFKLPLANQAEKTVYIRVQSGSSMTLDFILWSPEAFAVNKIFDILGVGLFYGALLIVLGYHLFLFYSLREAAYFYFILFLACAILFFASYEGIADQYLWPGLSEAKEYTIGLTISLFFLTALKFSDIFLEQKTRSPRLHRLNYLFFGFWALMIVILPFISYATLVQSTSIGLLLTPAFAAVCGFSLWRTGYRPARFYLISWLGFIVGIISAELVRRGAIPSTPITEKAYQIGMIWLVLLWSLALADRINRLKALTESAYRSVRNSEQRLSQILEGMPLGVVLYTNDHKPKYVNSRSIDILSNPARGFQPDISAGRTLASAIEYFSLQIAGSRDRYPIENFPTYRALQGSPAYVDDIEINRGDEVVPLEMWASPIRDETGIVESAVAVFQDITQRKQSEAELDEYRKHLEKLVEDRTMELNAVNAELNAANKELQLHLDWLASVNLVNQIVARTSDFAQIYQKFIQIINQVFATQDSFIAELDENGRLLKILAHSCQRDDHEALIGSATILPIGIPDHLNFQQGTIAVMTRDQVSRMDGPFGEHIRSSEMQSIVGVPLQVREQVLGFLGLEVRDEGRTLTSQEASLLNIFSTDIAQIMENARLIEQAKVLVATEERNRIARELHDSVAQALYATSLYADAIRMALQADKPDSIPENLEELIKSSRDAMADMRLMIFQLRPPILDEEGLVAALQVRLEMVEARAGFKAHFHTEGKFDLSKAQETELYWIAQEILNNVIKHAQASEVKVELVGEAGCFGMTIEDNGAGFDPEIAEQSGGYGLRNIRERAENIGALCRITSAPGQGTKISIELDH